MKHLKKNIWIFLIMIVCLLEGCQIKKIKIPEQVNKVKASASSENNVNLNILTTDKVIYYMVKDIVGNKHNVDYMFKNREDEIIFKFTDDSLHNISKQDLFLYAGAGFEPWMDDFLKELNKSNVGVINISRGVTFIPYSKEINIGDVTLKNNPYYWTNIENYKIAFSNIKNAVEDKDPRNREYYESNFMKVLKTSESYSKDIKIISEKLKDYTFVIDEDDMDYFFKQAGIKAIKLNTDSDGIPMFTGNNTDKEKILKELKKSDKKVFFYNSSSILNKDLKFINQYNLKTVNLKVYDEKLKPSDIIKYNLDELNKINNR